MFADEPIMEHQMGDMMTLYASMHVCIINKRCIMLLASDQGCPQLLIK